MLDVPTRGGVALLKLVTQPIDDVLIVPELYLKAGGEVLALTLIICWIISAIFLPLQRCRHVITLSRADINHHNDRNMPASLPLGSGTSDNGCGNHELVTHCSLTL